MSGETEQMLIAWLERIEKKLDGMARNGCARADDHADAQRRLREVEHEVRAIRMQTAESRGKWVVIGSIFGMFSVPIATWIFRRITQ